MAKTNMQKAEELQELLRQSVLEGDRSSIRSYTEMLRAIEGRLKDEEWKENQMTTKINSSQINWDHADSNFPGRKPAATQIKSDQAYHTTNDDKGRCPYCYGSVEQRLLGSSTIDGEERPTYHCTGCNKAYMDVPSSVKVLMDIAKKEGHHKIGFTPVSTAAGMVNHTNTGTFEQQQANHKLDQLNQNFIGLMSNLTSLMRQVEQLAFKNNELMEKLATDPLVSVRKAVSEFNLK